MGLFSKRRFVVANVLVTVKGDSARSLRGVVAEATGRIEAAAGDVDLAAQELARVAGALVDRHSELSHAAVAGDVYEREEDAGARFDELFADNAGRYLSAADGTTHPEARAPLPPAADVTVVMLSFAYEGDAPLLERDLTNVVEVLEALAELRRLAERGRLEAAAVHVAPAHPDDHLDEERLLVNFPELGPL